MERVFTEGTPSSEPSLMLLKRLSAACPLNIGPNYSLHTELSSLEMIGATKFVKDYPNGINTNLDYLGGNLSTGEKQLISFARILLRNPSIIILDEATANIDTETEILIQNALKVLASGRTTFVVAHRLSTIRNADKIMIRPLHHDNYENIDEKVVIENWPGWLLIDAVGERYGL